MLDLHQILERATHIFNLALLRLLHGPSPLEVVQVRAPQRVGDTLPGALLQNQYQSKFRNNTNKVREKQLVGFKIDRDPPKQQRIFASFTAHGPLPLEVVQVRATQRVGDTLSGTLEQNKS